MTDQYMEQQGSKKKYLIPLVVLMLCAVSLTGAGYAYNSSVSTDGNITTNDAEILTLVDDDTIASKTIQFDIDYKSSTLNGTTTWTVDTTEGHSKLTDTFKLHLESTTGVAKKVTITVPATLSIGNNSFTVGVTGDGVTAGSTTGTYTVTVTPSTSTTDNDVTITVSLTAPTGTISSPMTADHIAYFTLSAETEDITHDDSAAEKPAAAAAASTP